MPVLNLDLADLTSSNPALVQKKARICVGLGMAQARDFEIDIPPSSMIEKHKLTPHLLQEIVEYALHLGYLHRSDPPTVGQCSAPSVLISFGGGRAGEAFF